MLRTYKTGKKCCFFVFYQRPELCNASIEIVAPDEYMVRAPQPPVYLFVMCVNKRAIDSGNVCLIETSRKFLLEDRRS